MAGERVAFFFFLLKGIIFFDWLLTLSFVKYLMDCHLVFHRDFVTSALEIIWARIIKSRLAWEKETDGFVF